MIISPEAIVGQAIRSPDAVRAAWREAMRAFREQLDDPDVLDVAVMIGIPGSGKSTWAQRHDVPRSVIFDAVWSRAGRRVALASRIRRAGKTAIAVWVKTPIGLCMQRQAERPAWRRVPEATIRRNALDLKRQPPTWHEGWHHMIVVRGAG